MRLFSTALALFVASAEVSHANISDTAASGNWTAFGGTTGDGNVCGIKANINGGTFILYASNARPNVLRLTLYKATWRIPDLVVPIELSFPNGASFALNGSGQQSAIGADIPESDMRLFIHRLTSDEFGVMQLPEGREAAWRLDLKGTAPMIDAMAHCVASAHIALPPPFQLAPPQNSDFGQPEPAVTAKTQRAPAPSVGQLDEGSGTPIIAGPGVSVVHGALICPDNPTFHAILDLYIHRWEDAQMRTMADAKMPGESRILYGEPATPLDLKSYGCALISPGTPMLEKAVVSGIPVVTAKLPDGSLINGVTSIWMVGER